MNATDREQAHPILNRDGSCHITRTVTTGVSQPLQEVWTDLGEKFAVFDRSVANLLLLAEVSGRRVQLSLLRTAKGRYVKSVQLYPCGDEATYPCIRCSTVVPRSDDGKWRCGQCHYIMSAD